MGFALIQLMGMLTMASNVYNTFCKDLFDPSKSWSTRIVEHKFSLFAIGCGIVFGKYFNVFMLFQQVSLKWITL